jgi:hypothetical protein
MAIKNQSATKKKPLLIVASLATVAIVLTLVTSAAINVTSTFRAIPSAGSITAVSSGGGGGGTPVGENVTVAELGIYVDSDCTLNLTSIDWGDIEPGEEVSYITYIKNLGNASVTLNLTTTNWSPQEASSSFDLSWDIDSSYVLVPDQTVQAMLTLAVAEDIDPEITSFNFDIQVLYTTVDS